MTATKALGAQGVLIKMGNGASPEVFNTIAEVKGFDGPGGSATVIDASTLDSTAKEKIMGLPDEGQFTMDVHFDPTNTNGQVAMQTARAARTKKNFKVTLTDSGAMDVTFSGYVTGFSLSGAVDNIIAAKITIEITGAVTYTP